MAWRGLVVMLFLVAQAQTTKQKQTESVLKPPPSDGIESEKVATAFEAKAEKKEDSVTSSEEVEMRRLGQELPKTNGAMATNEVVEEGTKKLERAAVATKAEEQPPADDVQELPKEEAGFLEPNDELGKLSSTILPWDGCGQTTLFSLDQDKLERWSKRPALIAPAPAPSSQFAESKSETLRFESKVRESEIRVGFYTLEKGLFWSSEPALDGPWGRRGLSYHAWNNEFEVAPSAVKDTKRFRMQPVDYTGLKLPLVHVEDYWKSMQANQTYDGKELVYVDNSVRKFRPYQHFLMDYLILLSPVLPVLLSDKKFVVIVPSKFVKRMQDILPSPDQVLASEDVDDKVIQFDKVHIAKLIQDGRIMRLHRPGAGAIRHFEENLAQKLFPAVDSPRNVVIYASRTEVKRAVVNNDQVLDVIKDVVKEVRPDWEVVEFNLARNESQEDIAHQAELFRRARFIVGPHGGAFANYIYSKQDCSTAVFEFVGDPETSVYQNLAAEWKNYGYRIYGELMRYHLGVYDNAGSGNCSIPIEDLKAGLHSILKDLQD